MYCSSCRRELPASKLIWRRSQPDVLLCQECLQSENVQADYFRNTIARALQDLRKTNRVGARMLLLELRGTGVPVNPKRRGHGERQAAQAEDVEN